MSIYDLTWRQWCGILALTMIAVAVLAAGVHMLMGRHEAPRDSVLRRAAWRIRDAIWRDYEEDDKLADDNGEPIGDLFDDLDAAGEPGIQGTPASARDPLAGKERAQPETANLRPAPRENVPWAGAGTSPLPASPGHRHDGEPVVELAGLGAAWDLDQPGLAGHRHDADLEGLDGEDAETVAQWRDDHDQLTEDSRPGDGAQRDAATGSLPPDETNPAGPETDGAPAAMISGRSTPGRANAMPLAGVEPRPGTIQAVLIGGQTVILDGQPSPRWQPDDTLADLRPEPRAGRPVWHHAVARPPLPAWIREALRADSVEEALADIWAMSQIRALQAAP